MSHWIQSEDDFGDVHFSSSACPFHRLMATLVMSSLIIWIMSINLVKFILMETQLIQATQTTLHWRTIFIPMRLKKIKKLCKKILNMILLMNVRHFRLYMWLKM